MSIVTMNMSQYEIERDGSEIKKHEDEVPWLEPALTLQQRTCPARSRRATIPFDLVSTDVESFMDRMYAYQRQTR